MRSGCLNRPGGEEAEQRLQLRVDIAEPFVSPTGCRLLDTKSVLWAFQGRLTYSNTYDQKPTFERSNNLT